jgi:hypothetical protein
LASVDREQSYRVTAFTATVPSQSSPVHATSQYISTGGRSWTSYNDVKNSDAVVITVNPEWSVRDGHEPAPAERELQELSDEYFMDHIVRDKIPLFVHRYVHAESYRPKLVNDTPEEFQAKVDAFFNDLVVKIEVMFNKKVIVFGQDISM